MSGYARVFITVLVCMLIWGGVSFAEDSGKNFKDTDVSVTVSAHIDRDSIAIGDKIKYIIEVKADDKMEIQNPVIDKALTGFAVRDFGSSKSGLFGKKTRSFWFLLDTYETGKYTIPGATVKYREKGSKDWQELLTNEVKLEVKSLLGDVTEKADIKDIKGPVGFPDRLYLYIFSGAAAALVIAAVIFLFLRKKKKAGETVSLLRPAHEIAYEALMELEKMDYPGTGRIKEYYTALSDIVRRYLENRFQLRAPEMTTEEFLQSVRALKELDSEQKSLLREFLLHCDIVKFARYNPETAEIEKSHGSARRFIDQTKQLNTGEKAA
ncbi:hypothetical protein BMS3Abin09_00348 [bacterium BMS3Abin09]|nr:hypothetical protein BMS3Abin09_00348 [bacterium BMS3Abin09]GBE41234.1 hypothetical protein BMS3Bbin09_01125 [bacterium BMS3Bbin09]